MAKLGADYCNKIAEGRGRGEQTFISQVKSGISADQHLRPGCVGHAHPPMCCGGVFSWLCAHKGNTWCDRW